MFIAGAGVGQRPSCESLVESEVSVIFQDGSLTVAPNTLICML